MTSQLRRALLLNNQTITSLDPQKSLQLKAKEARLLTWRYFGRSVRNFHKFVTVIEGEHGTIVVELLANFTNFALENTAMYLKAQNSESSKQLAA